MSDEPTQRIDTTKAVSMLVVSFFLFDLPRLATAIIPLAATIPAGLIGWIPLLGQMFAGLVIGGSNLLETLASGMLSILGYSTMGLWFMSAGVPLFGGRSPTGRVVTFLLTFLVSWLPVINLFLFFSLTLWTAKMLYDQWRDDKEKGKTAKTGYNGGKNFSRMRKPLRRYVHADTF